MTMYILSYVMAEQLCRCHFDKCMTFEQNLERKYLYRTWRGNMRYLYLVKYTNKKCRVRISRTF